MRIPVVTRGESPKYIKGSVAEEIPGVFAGLWDTLSRSLPVMLMIDVSREQTAGINVLEIISCFENRRSITGLVQLALLALVLLRVSNAKARVSQILRQQLKMFNISEFPLT